MPDPCVGAGGQVFLQKWRWARADFRAPRVRVARSAPGKGPRWGGQEEARAGTRQCCSGRAGGKGKRRGAQRSRVMATAAAPTGLRCVPSFTPTLQAPPLSRSVTESFFPPRLFAPGAGSHWPEGNTWGRGPRWSLGRGGAGRRFAGPARGGRGFRAERRGGREKVGRSRGRGGGAGRGWRCGASAGSST